MYYDADFLSAPTSNYSIQEMCFDRVNSFLRFLSLSFFEVYSTVMAIIVSCPSILSCLYFLFFSFLTFRLYITNVFSLFFPEWGVKNVIFFLTLFFFFFFLINTYLVDDAPPFSIVFLRFFPPLFIPPLPPRYFTNVLTSFFLFPLFPSSPFLSLLSVSEANLTVSGYIV